MLQAGYKTLPFSCSAQNFSVILFLIIHAVGFLFCTLLHARICKSSLTILRGLCLFDDGSLFKSQFLCGASSSSIHRLCNTIHVSDINLTVSTELSHFLRSILRRPLKLTKGRLDYHPHSAESIVGIFLLLC